MFVSFDKLPWQPQISCRFYFYFFNFLLQIPEIRQCHKHFNLLLSTLTRAGQLASELEDTFNSEFSYVLQPPSGKWIRGPSSKEAGCLIDVNNSSHRILITDCLIVCRWIGDPWVEVRLYFVHLTYSGTTRQQPAKMWQNAYSRWTLTMLGQHSASVISIWWQKTLYVSHRPMPI